MSKFGHNICIFVLVKYDEYVGGWTWKKDGFPCVFIGLTTLKWISLSLTRSLSVNPKYLSKIDLFRIEDIIAYYFGSLTSSYY